MIDVGRLRGFFDPLLDALPSLGSLAVLHRRRVSASARARPTSPTWSVGRLSLRGPGGSDPGDRMGADRATPQRSPDGQRRHEGPGRHRGDDHGSGKKAASTGPAWPPYDLHGWSATPYTDVGPPARAGRELRRARVDVPSRWSARPAAASRRWPPSPRPSGRPGPGRGDLIDGLDIRQLLGPPISRRRWHLVACRCRSFLTTPSAATSTSAADPHRPTRSHPRRCSPRPRLATSSANWPRDWTPRSANAVCRCPAGNGSDSPSPGHSSDIRVC